MENLLFNDKWITVHGQHIKIDDDGNPVAGNPKVLGDKPASPHEGKAGKFEHKGHANLAKQGFKPKKRGEGDNQTHAAQVAWQHAITTGKTATAQITGRGWAVLRPDEAVAYATPHMTVNPEGDVHRYNPKFGDNEDEKSNHIEKVGDEYRLLSHDGKNLGTFKTREEAEKHEREVEYFKHKENAKEFPKIFYARHMLPGIARYESVDPVTKKMTEEHLWIDADGMKQSAPSMVGKPIYVNHQKVNLATLQEDADGYVTECFYNELDGWLWAKFLAISDEAQNAISRKWSVSNAYIPQEWDGAGSHLNVDYDKKIRKHNFTHLAIVPNPRYEEAKIFTPEEYKDYQAQKRSELDELQNSKPNEGHPMFKFFQKKDEELKNGLPADADLSTIEIELESGKRVPLSEIINAVKKNDEDEAEAKKAREEDEKKNKGKMTWNDDTMVTVGDEKMPMKDLMNKYNAMSKMNDDKAKEEKKKEEEDKEKKEKENAEKEKKEKEEKANSAIRMKEMQNAHNKAKVQSITTVIDKKKRGSEMFGSAKK